MDYHYQLCGWHLRSELPIPELLPLPQPDGQPVDITLTVGEVPEDVEDNIGLNGFVKVSRDGTVILNLANTVRFRVQAGQSITMQTLSDVGAASWRLYFLGTVLQYLCHQRGLYPLHAASLHVGGRTIAIAGHRGDGKSTLALELIRRGHRLLSDDLTVLRAGIGGVEVLPSFPRLKLWRQSLDAAGVSSEGLARVRPDMEKFDLNPRDDFDPAPARLDCVMVLAKNPAFALERQSALLAVALLRPYVCRPGVAHLLGRDPDLLRFTGLIASKLPVYHLKYERRFDQLAVAAAALEDVCR